MARHVRLRELLVGVEGLALLRTLYDGTDADADRRIEDVRRILADDTFAEGEAMSEAGPVAGYRAWAGSYDEPGNPLVALEEPAVWSLLDARPAGRALDAACGTGRHASHLVARGHDVVGVDLSPDMLAVARDSVPEATFRVGDLVDIPAERDEFDVVACGLAIAHVADLAAAVRELARVLRPGGHLVLSALHPFQALLGWHAPFADDDGARHFVREYTHTHADCFAAFRAAGLRVEQCTEPAFTPVEVQAKRRAFGYVPEAALAAYTGLPAVLVWHATKYP
jgi:SAM-dependent methyltransferase